MDAKSSRKLRNNLGVRSMSTPRRKIHGGNGLSLAAAIVLGTAQGPAQATTPTPVPVTVSPGVVLEGVRPVAFAPAPNGSKIIVCLEDGSVRIVDSKTHQTRLKNLFTRHVAPAYAAAWSADGLLVATGDESARIFVESPLSGEKIREYRTHIKGIEKLSFNITRQYLMSTGKDDQINVYDLSSPSIKEAHKILGKGANFYGATFDPKLPYTISTGILGPGGRCYDCVSGKLTGFLATQDDQGVFDIAYNPNGTREVTAGKDGDAIIFDAMTLKEARHPERAPRLGDVHGLFPERKADCNSFWRRTIPSKFGMPTHSKKWRICPRKALALGSPLCLRLLHRTAIR